MANGRVVRGTPSGGAGAAVEQQSRLGYMRMHLEENDGP